MIKVNTGFLKLKPKVNRAEFCRGMQYLGAEMLSIDGKISQRYRAKRYEFSFDLSSKLRKAEGLEFFCCGQNFFNMSRHLNLAPHLNYGPGSVD